MAPNNMAGSSAGQPARGPEFQPVTSFDACYPWKPGTWEPPTFQLLSESKMPFEHLFVMPGTARLSGQNDGWEAKIDEQEFGHLWELGKLARQQTEYQDFTQPGQPRYLMSIGCGSPFGWNVWVDRMFAMTEKDAVSKLAKRLFEFIDNPPANATH